MNNAINKYPCISIMKMTFTMALFLNISMASAQTESTMASIKAELPNITPASPTVAALMKFEEVPVNNYTGIPDISLPIYTMPTLSKDITIGVSLKYHPSAIQKDEMAGYTGLGWSLIAGGSISRTVRGLPDEIYVQGTPDTGPESHGADKTRVGIYNVQGNNYYTNRFYQVMGLFGNFTTPLEQGIIGEYCWKAFEKGVFDSDHDLYQFNFMGRTGRFYVKRNPDTGALEAVNLFNDQSIKIIANSTLVAGKYDFSSFTIYDDKGYRYEFEDKEITTDLTTTVSSGFVDGMFSPSSSSPMVYTSGFQLSRIYDANSQLLATFTYTSVNEAITRRTKMTNRITPHTLESEIIYQLSGMNGVKIQGMLPKTGNTMKVSTISTKKLSEILIANKGRIEFQNEAGRQDYNMTGGNKLKSINVKTLGNAVVKRFEFNYNYFNVQIASSSSTRKRLALTEMIERPGTGSEELKHKLEYKNLYVEEEKINYDKWGYPNNNDIYKPVSNASNATGILQKITFPTGGSALFDFGSNTYSYIGNEALTDFSQNPENSNYRSVQETIVAGPSTGHQGEIILGIQLGGITRYLTYNHAASGGSDDSLVNLLRVNTNGTYSSVPKVNSEHVLLPGVMYIIRFSWLLYGTTGSVTIDMLFRTVKPVQTQAVKGGGFRINNIYYFDWDVPSDYLQYPEEYPTVHPVREKNYDYNFFGTTRSSGSLVFPEPVFSYDVAHPIFSLSFAMGGLSYTTTTDYNVLQTVRTHGSDVGYKNVTVSEKDNGKSEFEYQTPIDHPEENYTTSYPFIPSINKDFKRGQLLKERLFKKESNQFQLLSETAYAYAIDSVMVVTGIRGNNVNKCPRAGEFGLYSQYMQCVSTNCGGGGWDSCNSYYFLNHHTVYDSYGWSKLTSKTKTEYFYSPTVQTIQSQESYTYNPINKRIASHTVTNALGEQFKTDYTYHSGNSALSQNRVSEIERIDSYKDAVLMSSSKINYGNAWGVNTSYLPQSIQTSKGSQALEDRIRFNRYDQYGNVLEVQQEGGMKTSYIWGYNKSVPVAKIENMAYANIPIGLINTVQAESDLSVTGLEANLLLALKALRDAVEASGAFVTTMTYVPLVGVSTSIDPKGSRTTYAYDNSGRLISVRDHENKFVSQHSYNYRP